MAGEHPIDIRERLRYFPGLFLNEEDFTLDQRFHMAARRYLNYLLFKPGRLYTDDAVPPLQVTGSGTSITISPGSALICDDAGREAYEVHLADAVSLNLATGAYGFAAGDTVEVRLEFDEVQRDSGTAAAGGAGILVTGNNRWVERAVIRLLRTSPDPETASGNPFIALASLDLTGTAGGPVTGIANLTNTAGRGGIRLEILSDDIRALLAGGPSGPTLVSIALSPPDTLSLTVDATTPLTATGHFDTGPDRPLTPAGDGLVWLTNNPMVATVSDEGVVSALHAGLAQIRATVGNISSAALAVTVTEVVTLRVDSFMPPSGPVETTTITIDGTGFATGATVTFTGAAAVIGTFVSDTQITAMVPAGAITGPFTVRVGTNSAGSALDFGVVPTIAGFSPPSGPVGREVTINGTGFTTEPTIVTSVTFGGTAASPVTVNSITQITATVPTGAATGPIVVTVAGIPSAPSASNFEVRLPPEILTTIPGIPDAPFHPNSGRTGTPVSIWGRNFGFAPTVEVVNTAGAVMNTFTDVTVTAGSSGGVAFQRIDARVGATSGTLPRAGRIRVTESPGNFATTATNFTLLA